MAYRYATNTLNGISLGKRDIACILSPSHLRVIFQKIEILFFRIPIRKIQALLTIKPCYLEEELYTPN